MNDPEILILAFVAGIFTPCLAFAVVTFVSWRRAQRELDQEGIEHFPPAIGKPRRGGRHG